MSVGPVGVMILAPFYFMAYLCWLMCVGIIYLFRFVIPLAWSLAVFAWSLVMLGWAHMRARSRRPASG